MTEQKRNTGECLNCGAEFNIQDKFCSSCGQETKRDDSVRGFIGHFLADYFTFDSKFTRSILPLLTKPGFLTIEYLMGRRVQYILPLRMFIFTSIILFLVIGFSGSINPETDNIDALALDYEFWDNFFKSILPKIFFLLLPVFAILLKLLHHKISKYFLVDFLFAVHFHTFLFLVLLIYLLLSSIFNFLDLTQVNLVLFGLTSLYIIYYIWRALQLVYGQGPWKSLFKLILLAICYGVALLTVSFAVIYLLWETK